LPVFTPVLAPPVKSSFQTVVQLPGGGEVGGGEVGGADVGGVEVPPPLVKTENSHSE
jgi:hypothetical protein